MRKLHKKFHDAFINECLKNFDSAHEQRNYCIEIPFGNTFITFYVDYEVLNYNYDERTNSVEYDREIFVRDCDVVYNENFKPFRNINYFLVDNYIRETFKL